MANETITDQSVLGAALAILAGIVGWAWRMVTGRLTKHDARLRQLETTTVTRGELKDAITEIGHRFDQSEVRRDEARTEHEKQRSAIIDSINALRVDIAKMDHRKHVD